LLGGDNASVRDRLNSGQCSKFLKALADPERLRIVQCLQAGPLPVGEISERLNSPLANVSHHLKQLRVAGLVTGHKRGRHVIYSLAARVLRPETAGGRDVIELGCCRLELGQK
jgi:DNA-binding transcriptional ArsR family regulator